MGAYGGYNPMPMEEAGAAPPGQSFLGATLGIAGQQAAHAYGKLRNDLNYMVGSQLEGIHGLSNHYADKVQESSDDIVNKLYGDKLDKTSMMDYWAQASQEATPKWRGAKKGVRGV